MSERKRPMKNQETSKDQRPLRKRHRKAEAPVRIIPTEDLALDVRHPDTLVCKNSVCRAILYPDDTFCRRCSCCICHRFDDDKDASLWLVCTSDSGSQESCGLSCHLECALQRRRVGVVDQGQLMQLDGGYCCDACGKVSCILGFWKKQLIIARDARTVGVLCFRISISCRLLDGTSRFQELHKIMESAKARLEIEVGPLDGLSAKMAKGIAGTLSCASEVQKLISLAIEKADGFLAAASNSSSFSEASIHVACRFHFEEVTSSSVVIVLADPPADAIKGYKLWYCKTRDETHPEEPISSFSRSQRRILISNLQSGTEYSFRIVSFSDTGNLGQSEAICFTQDPISGYLKETAESSEAGPTITAPVGPSSGFKVRSLGIVLQRAWAREEARGECSSGVHVAEASGSKSTARPEDPEIQPPSGGLDLPDLNDEPDRVEDDGALAGSGGSGNSQNFSSGQTRDASAADSRGSLDPRRTLSPNGPARGSNGNGPPARVSDGSASPDDLELCVRTIWGLERQGHVTTKFRLNMLTWLGTRATPEEQRVVATFIRALVDDPSSLAAQLIDSFSEKINTKKPTNGSA